MRIVFTDAAEADLEAIGDWIARDHPQRAASFVRELRDRCMSLDRMAKRFPVARRVGAHLFRKIAYRDYLIFYEVGAARVEIVRILHGARDWASLIEPRAPDEGPEEG